MNASDFLITEFRTLTTSADPEEKAKALVNELIQGPTARGVRTVPRQTKLIGIKTGDDGLLSINFGSEMVQYHPEEAPQNFLPYMPLLIQSRQIYRK